MKSKETPTNGKKKYSHNKSRSQSENVIVRAITKYNERDKIYNSCSLESKLKVHHEGVHSKLCP